jgi:hypothetical protein
MVNEERITPEIASRINKGLEDRPFKLGPNHRIVFAIDCPQCGEKFYQRRKNHKYCSNSCKSQASYERNGYKYQSGRYVKNKEAQVKTLGAAQTEKSSAQEKGLDWKNVAESAIAGAGVEATKYLLHDRFVIQELKAINQKIDSLTQVKIQDRIRNLEFVGNKYIQGNFFALFKDPRTGRLNLCDGQNNWFTYDQGQNQLLPKR